MADAPEVFDADAAAVAAEVDYPPFPFKWKGEVHHLPNMGMLSTDEAIRLAEAMQAASTTKVGASGNVVPDEEAFFGLLDLLDEVIGDPESVAAVRDMPGTVMAQVLVSWEAASMEGLGELGKEDSEPSGRNRAERRSKSTSRPKASTSTTSRSTKSGRKSAA